MIDHEKVILEAAAMVARAQEELSAAERRFELKDREQKAARLTLAKALDKLNGAKLNLTELAERRT